MSSAALWLLVATVLSLLGMSWLALAMKVHWQQVFNNRVEQQNSLPNAGLLRVLGGVAIISSGLCCLQADHASMAVLVWFMLLTLAAFTVAMTLTSRPGLLALALLVPARPDRRRIY